MFEAVGKIILGLKLTSSQRQYFMNQRYHRIFLEWSCVCGHYYPKSENREYITHSALYSANVDNGAIPHILCPAFAHSPGIIPSRVGHLMYFTRIPGWSSWNKIHEQVIRSGDSFILHSPNRLVYLSILSWNWSLGQSADKLWKSTNYRTCR